MHYSYHVIKSFFFDSEFVFRNKQANTKTQDPTLGGVSREGVWPKEYGVDKVGQVIGIIKYLDTCEEPFAYFLTGNKQAQ